MEDRKTRKSPELLVPAGSLEVLRTAVDFGADAVYIGGQAFSLRAKAKNFSHDDMKEGIAYAHDHGVKVHVTANILAHNYDLEAAAQYFDELEELCPDAVIIADPGMVMLAKEHCPDVSIHLSTQANNTNYLTYRFWYEQGVKRVVSARELSLDEIKQIRDNIPRDMEIESFIHGSMCISYSGRCLLSNYLTGRDANRGACTHPCRWKYALMEEEREGEYFPVFENERGTFIFNSGDLCMIEHIPEMIDAGIDSFKIEGRMKTALYVATVARTYRKAIDAALESDEAYKDILPWCREQIGKCTYRKFNSGFYFGKPGADSHIYDNSTYEQDAVYLGQVESVTGMFDLTDSASERVEGVEALEKDHGKSEGSEEAIAEAGKNEQKMPEASEAAAGTGQTKGCIISITQKNKFSTGDKIEIMKSDGSDIQARVLWIENEDGQRQPDAPHAKQKLFVGLDKQADAGDILRTKGK